MDYIVTHPRRFMAALIVLLLSMAVGVWFIPPAHGAEAVVLTTQETKQLLRVERDTGKIKFLANKYDVVRELLKRMGDLMNSNLQLRQAAAQLQAENQALKAAKEAAEKSAAEQVCPALETVTGGKP